MAATSTYTPISTQTLASGATSVTFNSFSGYTDLVLQMSIQGTTTTDALYLYFNGDSNRFNYSFTRMAGIGGAASGTRGAYSQVADYVPNATSFMPITVSIADYANATTYKTYLSKWGIASDAVAVVSSTWRNTAPITSFSIVLNAADNIKAGSTFSLYGIANNTAGAKATGGAISSDSAYFYHSFYSTGTFTPTQSLTCDYLVVAGGGGAGMTFSTGTGPSGGGAGGLRSTVTATGGGGTLESALAVLAQGYTVTVGGGGAGATSNSAAGAVGNNSVFSSITSTGGGGGGAYNAPASNGGSGGGGAYLNSPNKGTGMANQGFDGGTDATAGPGSGGGGAGAVGGNTTVSPNVGGNGGIGVATAVSGLLTYYAGGGGGGGNARLALPDGVAGKGGLGGGGDGSRTGAGNNAIVGTGGGGGAGSLDGSQAFVGGNGASGVVIIRYAR
ncbi:hypothetical protein UFOVP1462_50 [uncultured Caudovirales phage]|uniref:Glycine-rich domain-containing protein n=1 Tax=uncultured Caudovirales phage TaxID=2100421 RepID=A0A6J5RVN9_9CAUD|nr:hypothetical protein UFOVP1013_50 [uncultured Caudovirales phage]CAB4202439.1 hypothetical protein UFOVP1364_12 [uncultured Caudovirales phage]CAB4214594.1 hypothetical protein UFOVP1462_50 [uncultured Caudovirales phage]CAB5228538.1 hypothetical protein UFOVP1550_4 [uncultured Caudovirales phage]